MKKKEYADKLNDTEEELHWWRGYAESLETGIKEMRDVMNESHGVDGYHLNGDIATWDELLTDSAFEFAEDNIKSKKEFDTKTGHVISKMRAVLYIKEYENMPCTVQYDPFYGGIKYIRDSDNE